MTNQLGVSISFSPRRLWLIALLLIAFHLVLWGTERVLAAPPASSAPPNVANVDILSSHVVRYEKFEAEFDVQTVAPYPDLPYDASPPPGLTPGMGVTVDVLFSS